MLSTSDISARLADEEIPILDLAPYLAGEPGALDRLGLKKGQMDIIPQDGETVQRLVEEAQGTPAANTMLAANMRAGLAALVPSSLMASRCAPA